MRPHEASLAQPLPVRRRGHLQPAVPESSGSFPTPADHVAVVSYSTVVLVPHRDADPEILRSPRARWPQDRGSDAEEVCQRLVVRIVPPALKLRRRVDGTSVIRPRRHPRPRAQACRHGVDVSSPARVSRLRRALRGAAVPIDRVAVVTPPREALLGAS
eukprot:759187-Hanusia_phi.AAC.7